MRVIGWPAPCQEPTARELNGEDPTAFVLSANIHRRHMTKGQRAMAVAMVTQPAKGGRGKTVPVLEGFSKQRISEARTVLQHAPDLADGTPEAVTAVEIGGKRLSECRCG